MREIKFRGQINNVITDNEGNVIKEFKSWVYGDLLHRPNGVLHLLTLKDEGFYENHAIDPDTISQFTGLKDKSGKEIYEGDLIKAPSGRIYAVIFSTWKHEEKREFPKVIDLYEHTGWCISLDGVNPCELLDFELCQGSVIGSVYDNPELLKGGNHESNV